MTQQIEDLNIPEIRKGIRVLRKVRGLIAEPTKWTKGGFARDAKGRFITSAACSREYQQASCYCALGAIAVAQKADPVTINFHYDPAATLLERFVMRQRVRGGYGGEDGIPELNDKRNTTHEQVLNSIDFAILQGKEELKRRKSGLTC